MGTTAAGMVFWFSCLGSAPCYHHRPNSGALMHRRAAGGYTNRRIVLRAVLYSPCARKNHRQRRANRLGVHPNTIRTWTGDFADHLSGAGMATPAQTQHFEKDDVLVIWPINVHRDA